MSAPGSERFPIEGVDFPLTFDVACDFDGVMVNTAYANKTAYAGVGATWVPNRPWREFATPEQHEAKLKVYPFTVSQFARILRFAFDVYRPDWLILTGASLQSVKAVTRTMNIDIGPIAYGLSNEEKVKAIREFNVRTYFDDDPAVIDLVLKETSCQAFLARPR